MIATITSHFLDFFRNRKSRTIGLIFAVNNIAFSSWIAHIPYIKQHLGLNDGALGMALFGMPLGLLLMNPLTGTIIHRLGAIRATILSAFCYFLFVQTPVHAWNYMSLAVGLVFCGLAASLMNVSMNTCAVYVEKEESRNILSSCHGMWSLGGVLGAGLAGVFIWAGLSPKAHMLITGIGLAAVVFFYLSGELKQVRDYHSGGGKPSALVRPNLALWLMIFTGMSISMAEGLAFDWSGVYMRQYAGAPFEIAALGFAVFAVAMTLGRFGGDAIVPIIGEKKILRFGALCIAMGIVICVLMPGIGTCLAGFFILGAGCSLGNPMLYAMSMRIPGIVPAAGLATFASLSMLGFLAGPPLIGFIAEAWSLPFGLVFVAFLSLIAFFIIKFI